MRSNLENFTLKHRVFLVKYYYQFTGDYLCVKTKYEDNYRDSDSFPAFSYDALMEIVSLFERTGSVFDQSELPDKTPGSSQRPIERVFVKQEEEVRVIEEQDSLSMPVGRIDQDSGDSDADIWDDSDFFAELQKPPTKKPRMSRSEEDAVILASMKKSIKGKLFPLNKDAPRRLSDHPNFSLGQKSTDSADVLDDVGQENAVKVSLHASYDRKFDGMSKKLDNILRLLKSPVNRTHVNIGSAKLVLDDTNDRIDLNCTFPMTSIEELETLNENLGSVEYKAGFIKELSRINGFSGTSEGLRAAYRLCDYIFDRNLMNAFSWTGLSKKNIGKERFNKYTRIIETFGEIIMLADTRFSAAHNEEFFKLKVLKHSEARAKKKSSQDSSSISWFEKAEPQ